MRDLHSFCAKQPKRSVLLSALGFHCIPGASASINALMEHAVVIGIDTEAWTKNTDEMTEIGLAVFERKDMVDVQIIKAFGQKKQKGTKMTGDMKNGADAVAGGDEYDHLGPFGEELMRKITFHHLRIVETAHLKTNAAWMKGPEGNRFGHSRFVTFAEARRILDSLFCQPIPTLSITATNNAHQDLKGCKRPIILVGHAMYHDEAHFRKNGLSYDLFQHGTVVKQIDTQPLAKATHTWLDPAAPSNDVGLDTLTRTLGFEHEDAHTACNDAARTLISAIQMVLPKQCREGKEKNMQDVALDIEKHSRETIPPVWGSEKCCTRCGGRDHQDKEGERECAVPVHCKACAQLDGKEGEGHWTTHIEMYCLHVAEYKGWARRRDDALRKRNPIPSGPPEGSHPPSNAAIPSYARCEQSDASLTRSGGSSEASSRANSSESSSSSTTSSGSIGAFVSSSDHPDHIPIARVVSFQSSGRGRGGGRGIRGVGGTRGGSVLSRNWRRGDDWRPITKW